MEKKVPWHQRWRGVNRGIYCHFCQKNAFFGQKMTVFWKVHFKQKLSVAQNTVFKWVKNIFLLFHPKLVFFTRFYLYIMKVRKKQYKINYYIILRVEFSERYKHLFMTCPYSLCTVNLSGNILIHIISLILHITLITLCSFHSELYFFNRCFVSFEGL